MKRLCQTPEHRIMHLSVFEGWERGIRNTGRNLGTAGWALDYYMIANDNTLEGL